MVGDRSTIVGFNDNNTEGKILRTVSLVKFLIRRGFIIQPCHVKIGVEILRRINDHIPKTRNAKIQFSIHIKRHIVVIGRKHGSSLMYDESYLLKLVLVEIGRALISQRSSYICILAYDMESRQGK